MSNLDLEALNACGVKVVFRKGNTIWFDCVGPNKKELTNAAKLLGLHSSVVRDCLDPHHLPKVENFDSFVFLILRVFDPKAKAGADSIHDITRKIALFSGSNFVLTVRRTESEFFKEFLSKWQKREDSISEDFRLSLLLEITNDCFQSFSIPTDQLFEKLDLLEATAFQKDWNIPLNLAEVYPLKRRAASIKRVLNASRDAITNLKFGTADASSPEVRDVRDNLQNNLVYADELNENIQQYLALSLAMQTHKTNESMRFLAVFSAFFMPLTLFVGIYGMNFKFMPELEHPYGYAGAWISMFAITGVIAFWFRKKRWF